MLPVLEAAVPVCAGKGAALRVPLTERAEEKPVPDGRDVTVLFPLSGAEDAPLLVALGAPDVWPANGADAVALTEDAELV